MKILLFLFFITLVSLGHSLNCISARTFNMSSTNFNFSLFQGRIYHLKDYSPALCRIKMQIDIEVKFIHIRFTKALAEFNLPAGYVRWDTHIWPSDQRESEVTHRLEHACSTDNCDRLFVLNHIRWIISSEQVSLVTRVDSLMVGQLLSPCKYLQ